MVGQYEEKTCINVIIIKRKNKLSSDINIVAVEESIPMSEIGVLVVYTLEHDGVLFPSQESAELTND